MRHEYQLTAAGRDLWPVIVSLLQWGDDPPWPARGRRCCWSTAAAAGGVDSHRMCTLCGSPLVYGGRDRAARGRVCIARPSVARRETAGLASSSGDAGEWRDRRAWS